MSKVSTRGPEADARQLQPPSLVEVYRQWGGIMDVTILAPFNFWMKLATAAASAKPASEHA